MSAAVILLCIVLVVALGAAIYLAFENKRLLGGIAAASAAAAARAAEMDRTALAAQRAMGATVTEAEATETREAVSGEIVAAEAQHQDEQAGEVAGLIGAGHRPGGG